jgi:hypothetical protein
MHRFALFTIHLRVYVAMASVRQELDAAGFGCNIVPHPRNAKKNRTIIGRRRIDLEATSRKSCVDVNQA